MEIRLNELKEWMQMSQGVDISVFEESFLMKALSNRGLYHFNISVEDYYDILKNDFTEAKAFKESLHVGFSEFFRNPLTCACLEQIILPQLCMAIRKTKKSTLRVWSAACASGQEPYSLAILFDEMFENSKEKLEVNIFATDNSQEELEKAEIGSFHESSLNRVSYKRIRNYFTQKNDYFEIAPAIKKMVDFSFFDLLSDASACPAPSIYGNFDVVFCSNVLFYYKPDSRKAIIEKISNTMAPGAFLVTGETERDILLKNNFHEVFENSAIFKKSV